MGFLHQYAPLFVKGVLASADCLALEGCCPGQAGSSIKGGLLIAVLSFAIPPQIIQRYFLNAKQEDQLIVNLELKTKKLHRHHDQPVSHFNRQNAIQGLPGGQDPHPVQPGKIWSTV